MTKVRLYELIRRAHKVEELGIRALAKKFNTHRRTVRAALESSTPKPRKQTERPAPVVGPYRAIIAEWLLADTKAPRKQRHTGNRIWERLLVEHGCEATPSTIRREVARIRRELAPYFKDAFVPQMHEPGKEGEVDFYEAKVKLGGVEQTIKHFCLRACHSGREFHLGFIQSTQQAFLEAHNEAFAHFGGVFELIRYDNLGQAVKKVLQGRKREETERFIAMRSHYLFESAFCKPGVDGAHEKGGVENGQGRFRRAHLVPVPEFADLATYNAYLLDCCARDDLRVMDGRTESVAAAWEREKLALNPLPKQPFDTDVVSRAVVDSHGRVRIANNKYSVPISLRGLSVELRLGAREVRCIQNGREVARHERLTGTGGQSLKLDHYIDLIVHRPGALRGSIPLAQARATGEWPKSYDALWAAFVARHGKAEGTRQMVAVLLLHREHGRELVEVAAATALERGCIEAEAVKHLVRHLDEPLVSIVPLGELGDLARYDVPVPNLADYDALLEVAS
jgi:transposase